jgi:hypothetical protein
MGASTSGVQAIARRYMNSPIVNPSLSVPNHTVPHSAMTPTDVALMAVRAVR